MQNLISKAAEDLIIREEVSSEATYRAHYQRPEWPGGASGITIGIGYDVGAGVKSRAQLYADWDRYIPREMIAALEPAIGVTSDRAHRMLAGVSSQVSVPWEAAIAVFENVDVPRWYNICLHALPNFEQLNLDCRGVLVSLAYNRGPSFNNSGPRYAEMCAIRRHMINGAFTRIPGELRSMKRLWNNGLVGRREREAQLFEYGLSHPTTSNPPPEVQKSIKPVSQTTQPSVNSHEMPYKDHPDWSWNDISGMSAAAGSWVAGHFWHGQ